jgi:hypothetical protein
MPEIVIRELNGRVVIDTPFGRLGFINADAGRFGYDLAEQERFSVSAETGDPKRLRVVTYPCIVIDPAPVPEQGDTAPPDSKGQRATEPSPVSSGVGITAGSPP